MNAVNISARKEAGAVIFPSEANVFNAFNLTPFDKVKVVILGQGTFSTERSMFRD